VYEAFSGRQKAVGKSKGRRRVSASAILTLLAGFAVNGAAFLHRVLPAHTAHSADFATPDLVALAASARIASRSIAPSTLLCSASPHRAESLLAGRETPFTLTGNGIPDLVVGLSVVPKQFSHLSTKPILGRTFRPGDERTRRAVVVLSERLWRRSFGADPAVIGKTITLDAQDYIVIGIMPASFWFPHPSDPVELWVPAKAPAYTIAEVTS
jgi:putative ABC transport system permease protein